MHISAALLLATLAASLPSLANAATTCKTGKQTTVTDSFKSLSSSIWNLELGSKSQLTYSSTGINMTLNKNSDSIVLSTKKKWSVPASFEITMRASGAPGIVSPVVFLNEAGVTDEVDLEFVGGDIMSAQTVLWKNGVRGRYSLDDVSGANPATSWVTWKLDWTASTLTLSKNGAVVRTLRKTSSDKKWPSTQALRFKMGPWASTSTEWAGKLNWSKNPKPQMRVKKVTITGCAS